MLKGKELGKAIEEAINLKIAAGSVRSKAEIARHFGIQAPSIYDWIKKGSISKDKLPALWNYFSDVVTHDHWGISTSDIMRSISKAHQQVELERATPTEDEFAIVDQLDVAAACGDGKFAEHIVVKGGLVFKKSSLRDFGVSESAAKIIYASGDSMAPTIQHGRVVLINTGDREAKDGGVFAICGPDGELWIKRLIRDYSQAVGGMAWIMRSDNPDKNQYPDKVLPMDERTRIVGRAVWNDNRL
jgi:phage repressor protein C with HTH and peptisase S24 domain